MHIIALPILYSYLSLLKNDIVYPNPFKVDIFKL
nr:MAG TPA: hypothetical protein [Caudoviricetes sp.]